MALSYDTLNALVRDKFLPVLVNNVWDSNLYVARMLKKAKKHDSVKKIVIPLEYGRNTAQGMIGKYEKLNLTVPDPVTAAEYNAITAYQALSMAWEDEIEYNSSEAVVNGIKGQMKNAEMSFKKLFGEKVYQLNTAKETNDIEPLDGLVSATATKGGIAVADAPWWASNVLTSSDFGSTAISTLAVLTDPSSEGYIEKILRLAVSKATFAGQRPTVILTTKHLFDIMDDMISSSVNRPVSIKRTGAGVERMGAMGFDAMQFRGIPIIADVELYNNIADSTAGRIYAINENHLYGVVHRKGNMTYEPFAKPVDQLVSTAKILWRGNLVTDNRKAQSVVTGLLSSY